MKEHSDIYQPAAFDDKHSYLNEAAPGRQKVRLLWIVLGLRSSLFLVQLGAGLVFHSLSLLAVAGHMLEDIVTLGLALWAAMQAQRPSVGQATFGYRRLEILVALLNGLALILIAALIAWSAVGRFQTPVPASGLSTLIVAVLGLAVNSLLIRLLHQDSQHDLNLRGAFLHVVADAASFVSVILAAMAVYWLNWLWADAVGSLFVASLLNLSAFPLVRDSFRVLMEFAPPSINVAEVEAALSANAGVRQVERLHLWTITSGQVALSAHLLVESLSAQERDKLLVQLQTELDQNFQIYESTLQMTAINQSYLTSKSSPEGCLGQTYQSNKTGSSRLMSRFLNNHRGGAFG